MMAGVPFRTLVASRGVAQSSWFRPTCRWRVTACDWVINNSVARVKRIAGGQRLAEALLCGAIALFNHVGETKRAVEANIELGCCYYHQGLFELAHATLKTCVSTLNLKTLNSKPLL